MTGGGHIQEQPIGYGETCHPRSHNSIYKVEIYTAPWDTMTSCIDIATYRANLNMWCLDLLAHVKRHVSHRILYPWLIHSTWL